MKFTSLSFTAATLGMATAHTIMQRVTVGSTTYDQGEGLYMPNDNAYIGDVTSNSLACNGPPITGFTSSSAKLNVQAGETVSGAWLHTLTSTGPDADADNKVIDSSHKGPILAWLKKVPDATQNPSAGPGDGWFKIQETGLISPTEWAVDALIAAGGIHNVTIPSCIADGDYLLRFEIIALHSAYNYPGAQFYMECAQITVSGGTGTSTPSTVSLPGAYAASDPGITVNIYNGAGQPYPSSGQYTIPGPSLFTCGASEGNSAVSPAASSSTVSPATSSSTVSPAASSSTVSPAASRSTVSPAASRSTVSPAASSSTTSSRTTFATSYLACGATSVVSAGASVSSTSTSVPSTSTSVPSTSTSLTSAIQNVTHAVPSVSVASAVPSLASAVTSAAAASTPAACTCMANAGQI